MVFAARQAAPTDKFLRPPRNRGGYDRKVAAPVRQKVGQPTVATICFTPRR